MQTFAGDPACVARVPLASGRLVTAIDIQRHYLGLAEAHQHDTLMPAWCADVCRVWRTTLDTLERAPTSLSTTLDWAIKLPLYQKHAHRRGLEWEALRGQTSVPSETRETLRLELFEIDTRFGELGDHGIFCALDAAGVLSHRMVGVEAIDEAATEPPDVPRARRRSELVRQLRDCPNRYTCDWYSVWDYEGGRLIDMRDPFSSDATWQPWPGGPRQHRLQSLHLALLGGLRLPRERRR